MELFCHSVGFCEQTTTRLLHPDSAYMETVNRSNHLRLLPYSWRRWLMSDEWWLMSDEWWWWLNFSAVCKDTTLHAVPRRRLDSFHSSGGFPTRHLFPKDESSDVSLTLVVIDEAPWTQSSLTLAISVLTTFCSRHLQASVCSVRLQFVSFMSVFFFLVCFVLCLYLFVLGLCVLSLFVCFVF